MSSNIEKEAVKGMMEGIEICADLLAPTYGGAGTNVTLESNLRPHHLIVNDAERIIQAIKIKDDPAQKVGVDFIKELCSQQDKLAGNGRKTTILMAISILKNGFEALSEGKITPNKLKEELDSLIPFIESEIDKQTKKITIDDVEAVATTASESKSTGKLLQEIYKQIGTNGILNIEGSKTYETTYKLTDGVRFEMTGMLSPEMVHDEEARKDNRKETKAVYEKPLILITKKKITTDEDINPLLKEVSDGENKNLVIFTNDMDSGVASMLVNLHKNGGYRDKFGGFHSLNILIIKAPTMWQNYIFEDFAKCTGSTIVEDASGINFKSLKMEHLGTCDRIEVDQEDTILTGIKDITEHCKQLKEKGDDDSMLRLSWLATKSAILRLGANSATDLSYKIPKANDANRSTYLALQYGVVPGGGLCLNEIAINVGVDKEVTKILSQALQAPIMQAMANYGIDYEEYAKLITEDIVDASEVVKRAVRNAVGIASTILTAPSLVYIPSKTPEEMAHDVAMRQSNPFNQ